MSKRVLSGVKHVYLTPWVTTGGTYAPSTTSSDKVELTGLIGDSLSITQDDPTTSDIECETTDEPLYTTTKLGKYNVTMDSGDIQQDVLVKCLGFIAPEGATDVCHAPAAYSLKHAVIEVVMDSARFILPKVQLNSKIDASSLKTGVAKGTIAGTGNSAAVTFTPAGSGAQALPEFTAPFFVCPTTGTFVIADA